MSLKRALILVSIILIVVLLGACVRSASTPPTSIVTPPTKESKAAGEIGATQEPIQEGVKGQPIATNEVLLQLEQFVTQTAAAAQLAGGQQPGGVTLEGTPYPAEGGQQPAGQQPGSEPGATQPSAGQTTGGEPAAGQAAATQPSAGQTTGGVPAATQPSAGQTTGGQPAATQPSGGQPAATQSSGSQPAATQPSAGQQPVVPAPSVQPALPASTVPKPTPGIPTSYTLQSGEFPYCIARRFNVNPIELVSMNGLTTSSIVHGGTTLKIPQTGHPFPGERSLKAHPTVYVVQGTENIYEIACIYGDVSPDMIALANGLQRPYTLTSGQKLAIP